MRIFRALGTFGLFALAPVLALQALANAKVYVSPADQWNGFGVARQALARLQVEQQDGKLTALAVRPPGPALARKAFAKEPLATDALFVLSVAARDSDRADRSERVVRLTSRLEKRNGIIDAARLQSAASAGNLTAALGVLDRLTVVHPEVTPHVVKALLPFLSDPQQLPALERALRGQPAWAEAFWMEAPQNTEGLDNLLQLRSTLGRGATKQSDGQLLQSLIRTERYEAAFAFWRDISKEEETSTGFINSEEYPPFGWQLVQTADRSMTSAGGGRYAVHLRAETRAELARQLVRLAPGEYRIAVSAEPAGLAESLRIALQCVTGNASPDWRRSDRRPWLVDSSCNMFWLLIGADTWQGGTGVSGTLTGVAITAL